MLKKVLLLLLFFLPSCSGFAPSKESPVVYFSNASSEPIKNIRCDWKSKMLTLPSLNPGDTRSQSFYIRRNPEFFGLVKVSWTNAKGDEVTKDFNFTIKSLPSINDHTTYNYVQLYFDQNDVEVISSDVADLGGKTRKMDQVLKSFRDGYVAQNPVVPQTSLIRVEPKRDNSIPNWLINSY